MKRLVLALLVLVLFAGAQKPRTRFAGVWSMDIKESRGLPAAFQNVESFTMVVKQHPDSMVVAIQMAGGGQNVSFPVTVYRFSGAEVFREDTARSTKRWIKAQWSANGRILTLVNRVELGSAGKRQRYTQTDTWQLKGKDLLEMTMKTKYADSDSVRTQVRIYRRVK